MTTNNNINNTITNNDFDVKLATAGTSSTTEVAHSDNTNTGSNAELLVEVAGTSGGDPNIYFNIPSGSDYSLGIDNTVTDDLVITDSTSPSSGNNFFRLYSDGNRRLEKTPAFIARRTTVSAAQTGDGTTYTIVTEQTDLDQNDDYNDSTTFTAPVAGKYFIKISFNTRSWATQTDSVAQMVTSNQTYNVLYHGNVKTGNDTNIEEATVLTDFDSGDTFTVTVTISGGVKGITFGGLQTILGYLVA